MNTPRRIPIVSEVRERIEGRFISLTPEESEELNTRLEELGYGTEDGELKRFILESIREAEDLNAHADSPIDRLAQQIGENPEVILQAVNLVSGGIGNILSKYRKK